MSLAQFAMAAVPKKASATGRGKVAEGLLRVALRNLEAKEWEFTFNRIGDAAAAGKAFASQAGDFQAFGWGRNWLFEVKETQHSYRLPHSSFGPEQVARMRKREAAGTVPIVLVYHRNEKVWRNPDFVIFTDRSVGGSWDFQHLPTSSLSSFLDSILTKGACRK